MQSISGLAFHLVNCQVSINYRNIFCHIDYGCVTARLQIKFLPKNLNLPNFPRVRPIQNFWSILKRKVYLDGWKVETSENLIKRIKKVFKKCR
jgi:hypothetical protein